MSGPLRYDFGGLDAGHAAMVNGAGGFEELKNQWKGHVNATVMTWLSQDGVDFGDVNHLFDQAALATNTFLNDLAVAVQHSNMNAQDTLAQCRTMIRG